MKSGRSGMYYQREDVISRAIMVLGNERGSAAVVAAVSLFVLVGVLAFTLDTGYLFVKKNHYQNAVEAAAMAGASSLCAGDWEDIRSIVRSVAEANGITEEAGSLSVDFGFYDEKDAYADFPVYKDFVEENGMPDGEFVNAVLVSFRNEKVRLTGLSRDGTAAAMAVAFLRRLDMVSLDGDIRLGHNSEWENCTFFSNGDIKYPEAKSMGGKNYSLPVFTNCILLTVGYVRQCPVSVTSSWSGSKMTIDWNSGSPQSIAPAGTNMNRLTEIRPVDSGYLEYWRQRADVIYTPAQAGSDNVFYGFASGNYYVDIGGMAGSERRVIYFDAGKNSSNRVLIGPVPLKTDLLPHVPNGFSASNVTFVATCPILVQHNNTNAYQSLVLGAEGQEQAIIVSGKDIELNVSGIVTNGVVFRTGGDFLLRGEGEVKMRVIADGGIDGDLGGTTVRSYRGMLPQPCNCRFGPPCPPVLPKLGTLISSGS